MFRNFPFLEILNYFKIIIAFKCPKYPNKFAKICPPSKKKTPQNWLQVLVPLRRSVWY